MPKNNTRFERINEELKKEISNIINYELNNPNVTGLISVTKAKITPDLKYAKVYVSILNSKNIKETLAGLKKSSGYIRTEIAKRINLRITPELIFELDDSIEYGAKIDSILKDIMKDINPEKTDKGEE
ncbi:MAG: 30S ribosome-binding factor RbfA [Clostridia bacterium]|nr:30S ribosome-binding factor RbfA [Clostridia bacterium]